MPLKSTLPYTQVQDYLSEPVEGDDVVEFRLPYSGRLLGASRTDSRASVKHAIRRAFHPQLKQLWQTTPSLRRNAQSAGLGSWHKDEYRNTPEEQQQVFEVGISKLADNWSRCGYRFVPLITENVTVRCSLDILFLRPEEPGMIIRSGDLDARMKTLFDALRIPETLSEAGGEGPQERENPFFCLLQDDKLIADVSITTDKLLLLPKERELNANDAFLVIDVKIKPTSPGIHRFAV